MRGDEEGCGAINGLCTVYFVNGRFSQKSSFNLAKFFHNPVSVCIVSALGVVR